MKSKHIINKKLNTSIGNNKSTYSEYKTNIIKKNNGTRNNFSNSELINTTLNNKRESFNVSLKSKTFFKKETRTGKSVNIKKMQVYIYFQIN